MTLSISYRKTNMYSLKRSGEHYIHLITYRNEYCNNSKTSMTDFIESFFNAMPSLLPYKNIIHVRTGCGWNSEYVITVEVKDTIHKLKKLKPFFESIIPVLLAFRIHKGKISQRLYDFPPNKFSQFFMTSDYYSYSEEQETIIKKKYFSVITEYLSHRLDLKKHDIKYKPNLHPQTIHFHSEENALYFLTLEHMNEYQENILLPYILSK